MSQPVGRRSYAAIQAYNWALVASGHAKALKERDSAQRLTNTAPETLSEWQRWLLDHIGNEGIGAQQAVDLAEMWVRVAAVQPSADGAVLEQPA
ncbi:hypothetical protein AB0D37_06845 [Streptomyces sp. NPDC048384]|uniref:hypothetical protein n=1 Tax=Streptomyces sp. NPDC048384 TaxID=3155487 RepID=UPI00342FBB6E